MKKSKKMIKRKKQKNFIIFVSALIFCVFAVIFLSTKLKNDTIDIKADEIENKNSSENPKTSEVNSDKPKEVTLDNSNYLSLKDDPNADDASVVLPETMYKWNFQRTDGKKIAYLTFDDGPSENVTGKILDTLKDNNIKATFFTLGSAIEENPKSGELLKRMVKEGHAIANHGYSHDYKILYPNGSVDVNSFMNDMEKNRKILKEKLGKDFDTRVIRLPGGHGTWDGVSALDAELSKQGLYQVDWNSLNGDAEANNRSTEELIGRLRETIDQFDYDTVIVLMHDSAGKKTTAEYLQNAIDYLRAKGFEFRTLK
ncbi:polysaccharide deacetylase family protein [Clostridium septicum]|uniref:Polysaccharide deacetylase n=1 Tax=Clostridium septicum TaxID=1504 RepID=A0A9N7JLF8_CLOSE|nr:polysaccharide deacetylase family protein [Clostridium septicum]AYE34688.1 polysaccharide deacetylase [Clostridium septicum]MDU1312806.1 polysaccharide deacetylase family protein [Clostridium septicum]QAS60089.1 polysaccharide deacetylase [Clostridium septicum]UEC20667.1 polysaccharide deacetylase [Clostridium septicum]USS01282.1 polysaccharide deacetylase [Clostridium septicum]